MTNHIEGKVVAVTGAGGGFGRLICEKAAARGARMICADINGEGVQATVDAVRASGGSAVGATTDVTDLAQVKAMVAQAVASYGALDVMVNNAGVMPLAFYADHARAAAAWARCIDINVKGVLYGIIAAHDQMIAQGRGHVINISSIYGNFPVAGAGVYGATKAAVNFLSEALRVESQGKIKVTIVKPTGVPGTGLGTGIINPQALVGLFGQNAASYLGAGQPGGATATEGQDDPDDPRYRALAPSVIAEAVVSAIDQPWGVAIADITIRASGEAFIL